MCLTPDLAVSEVWGTSIEIPFARTRLLHDFIIGAPVGGNIVMSPAWQTTMVSACAGARPVRTRLDRRSGDHLEEASVGGGEGAVRVRPLDQQVWCGHRIVPCFPFQIMSGLEDPHRSTFGGPHDSSGRGHDGAAQPWIDVHEVHAYIVTANNHDRMSAGLPGDEPMIMSHHPHWRIQHTDTHWRAFGEQRHDLVTRLRDDGRTVFHLSTARHVVRAQRLMVGVLVGECTDVTE